ncbi:MAG: gfo/Idh/MocA family oxidoreductase, partial [Lentisphaerae bacterium]
MAQQTSIQDVGAALIGCGAISKAHIKAMKAAGVRILGLCDLDRDRARGRKEEFNLHEAEIYSDYRDLLNDDRIQIVGIATPPLCHLEQTVTSLLAGKYVYCEKPVCRRLVDFEAIFAAEKKSGRQAIFTTARFRSREPAILRHYIEEGKVGDIYRLQARHIRDRGRPGIDVLPDARWFTDHRKAITGITGDMGMYFMDTSMFLTDWPQITSVAAMVYSQFPADLPDDVCYDVEEHVTIFARTAGKLVFTFEFAGIAYYPYTGMDIFVLGTKGGLLADSRQEPKVRYRTDHGVPWRTVEEIPQWKADQSWDEKAYRDLALLACGGTVEHLGTTSSQICRLHEITQMAFR